MFSNYHGASIVRLFYNDDHNFWEQNWLTGFESYSNPGRYTDLFGPVDQELFSPLTNPLDTDLIAIDDADMRLDDIISLNSTVETSSVFGQADLDGTNGFVVTPQGIFDEFFLGYTVQDVSMGDINGDGITDIFVGHPGVGYGKGSAFAIFGVDSNSGGSFPSVLDMTALDGNTGFEFSGVDDDFLNGSLIGFSVAAGDFNGDGIDDFIIGHDDSNNESIYVVFGDDTTPFPADFDIDNLSSYNVLEIDFFSHAFHGVGEQVTIGDFDGDGVDDIAVRELGIESRDGLYVFYGDSSYGTGNYQHLEVYDHLGNTILDGSNGVHITNSVENFTNFFTEFIGDINGDGYEDIWVTADNSNVDSYIVLGEPNTNLSGAADVTEFNTVSLSGFEWQFSFGAGPVQSIGDINNDGIDDFSFVSRTQSFGIDTYIIFGGSNLTSIDAAAFDATDGIHILNSSGVKMGDMDNDGYTDLAINGPGGTHIVFGTAQGFGDTIDLENLPKFEWDSVSVNLTHLVFENGSNIMEFGDVNNDGFDDLYTGHSVIFGSANFGEVNNIYGDNTDNNLSVLTGTPYVDALWGFDGNDLFEGLGDADWINGGNGIDRVIYTQSTEGVYVDLQLGNNDLGHANCDTLIDIEEVEGSAFRDIIKGDWGANQLFGMGGNDTLFGRNGHDTIFGGEGNDFVIAGGGNDVVEGGNGGDKLHGNGGNDTLYGQGGNDFLWGGADIDIIDGGAGVDRALYTTSTAVTIDLSTGIHLGDAEGDIFINIERYFGSNDDDTLIGDGGINWLYGAGGADDIEGGGGADRLYGGSGNDDIFGGQGNDIIYGGSGFDDLYGEGGNDIFYGGDKNNNYVGGDGIDIVNYSKGNYGTVGVYIDFELGSFAVGAQGDSFSGIERVVGTDSIDYLYGGADDDYFRGEDGNDLFKGGAGIDRFWGGEGADTFIFESGHDRIMIADYDKAQGDRIDLSDYGFTGFSDLDINSMFREVITNTGVTWSVIDLGQDEIWIDATNVDFTSFDQDVIFLF